MALSGQGFTHAALYQASAHGLDVFAALRDVEMTLGLKPGDRLALAAMLKADVSKNAAMST